MSSHTRSLQPWLMWFWQHRAQSTQKHSNYSTSVLASPPPKTLPSKPSDICQFVRKILSKCQVCHALVFDVRGWKLFSFLGRVLAAHLCLLGFRLWKPTHGWHEKDGHRLPTWCPHSTFLALPTPKKNKKMPSRSSGLLLTNAHGQKWPFVPCSEWQDADVGMKVWGHAARQLMPSINQNKENQNCRSNLFFLLTNVLIFYKEDAKNCEI